MLVDTMLESDGLDVREAARRAEAEGYAGGFVSETKHDPALMLTLAATVTQRMSIGSAITVAFARTPMTMAIAANDLQVLSQGRLLLGLGSQIKAHITRRFAMPWSHPAPRMREFILAMRAIWTAWETSSPLAFEGEFYTHTLMTPFFDPGPHPYGPPKVLLAGVGELMTEVAGGVADGFLCHGFTTERYLRESTLPALQRGRDRAADPAEELQIAISPLVVTGRTTEQTEQAATAVRKQIAFYGSTPAYKPVLDAHGWGELQPQLQAMSRQGQWDAMGELITDDVLDAFAVVADPDGVGPEILSRFGDVAARTSLYVPYTMDDAVRSRITSDLRA